MHAVETARAAAAADGDGDGDGLAAATQSPSQGAEPGTGSLREWYNQVLVPVVNLYSDLTKLFGDKGEELVALVALAKYPVVLEGGKFAAPAAAADDGGGSGEAMSTGGLTPGSAFRSKAGKPKGRTPLGEVVRNKKIGAGN